MTRRDRQRPPPWLRAALDQAARIATGPHAPTGFRAVAALGRIANRVGVHGPSPSDVADLLPDASVSSCASAARRIAATHLRNHALVAHVRARGVESLARWTAWDGGGDEIRERGRARQPALLLTWHLGAALGLGAALHRLGTRVLVIRAGPFYPSTATVEVLSNFGSAEQRADVLRRAVDCLREGGQVMAALDGGAPPLSDDVPCLGRGIALSRGVLALARLARAPVIPLVARWRRDGTIGAHAYPALPWPDCAPTAAADFERRLATEAARWLEEYVRQDPGELWPSSLRWLASAPVLDSDDRAAPRTA